MTAPLTPERIAAIRAHIPADAPNDADLLYFGLTVGEVRALLTAAEVAAQARAEGVREGRWQPIETAPKDKPILAWCDHEADAWEDGKTPDGRTRLTLYASHAECLAHAKTGLHIIEWGGEVSFDEDEGGGYLPDWWFVVGSEFEQAANPTHWMPLPAKPGTQPPAPSAEAKVVEAARRLHATWHLENSKGPGMELADLFDAVDALPPEAKP